MEPKPTRFNFGNIKNGGLDLIYLAPPICTVFCFVLQKNIPSFKSHTFTFRSERIWYKGSFDKFTLKVFWEEFSEICPCGKKYPIWKQLHKVSFQMMSVVTYRQLDGTLKTLSPSPGSTLSPVGENINPWEDVSSIHIHILYIAHTYIKYIHSQYYSQGCNDA